MPDRPAQHHFEVRNEEIEQLLRGLAMRLSEHLPDQMEFALFLFDNSTGGDLYYISSAEREDIVTAMKEWIARNTQ